MATYKGISITFTKDSNSETLKTGESITSTMFKYEKPSANKDTPTVEVFPTTSISKVSYKMAMYEPEHYVVTISINGKPSFAIVRQRIVGATASVTLLSTDSAKDKVLSSMLFVHTVTPKYDETEKKTLVILDIYSLDKLLELQKFSHAYTGMRLGSDILKDDVPTYDKPGYGLTVVSNPRILSYTLKKDQNKSDSKDKTCEIIQPYTVQYNETFRSMINRVANRCGEYLYWNGTALQYGLQEPVTIPTLPESDIAEITGAAQESDDFKAFMVNSAHRNGAKGKSYISIASAETGKVYDNEVGTAEFSQPVGRIVGPRKAYHERPEGAVFGRKYFTDHKDGPDGHEPGQYDKKSSDPRKFLISSLLGKFLNSSSGFMDFANDFLTDMIVENPLAQLKVMKMADTAKKELNHRPFEGNDKDRYPHFELDEQTSYDSESSLDGDKAECYDKISHFSTCGQSGPQTSRKVFNVQEFIDNTIVLGDKFYTSIHEKGLKAKENSFDIVLTVSAEPRTVGEIIKYNGTEYVVTAVNGDFATKSKISIHIVPATKKDETTNYYLPEPLEQQFRHIDGNSTAFITDVKDPYGQERVRVRFAWQEEVPVKLNTSEFNKCHTDALEAIYGTGEKQKVYEEDLNYTLFATFCDCLKKQICDEPDETDQTKAGHYDNDLKDYVVNIYKVSTLDAEGKVSKTDSYSYYAYSKLDPGKNTKTDIKTYKFNDIKNGVAKDDNGNNVDFYVYILTHKNKEYPETAGDKITKKLSDLKAQQKQIEDDIKQTDKDSPQYAKLQAELNCINDEIAKLSTPDSDKTENRLYSKLHEPVKRLNDYKEKYKDLVKKAREEKTKVLECVDSTPWIRMASPMAGKNNMVIMKPTEETEVIVGFENGNIERPYVLGSLFAPGKCSLSAFIPGKNGYGEYIVNSTGDYKIIGENGAGMTITNENVKWDDIVSMIGFPFIKTITTNAPNLCDGENIWTDGKKEFPMGGKVRLHDKYGFYDLTMSSKERKVSISSPLGNISLSAFSGISISAPNGDITLSGKNITLKAGDKLTLISGTNKDIFDTQTTDIAGSLGKLLAKLMLGAATSLIGKKAVDLSNVRAAWEVLFRPLNGTMSLTSNHHMLLQAGKGKAEFPIDSMKAKNPASIVQIFPNYPFYLIMQILKSEIVPNIADKRNALNNAYAAVSALYNGARDNIESLDVENGPTFEQFVRHVLPENIADLSKIKVLHLLNKCLVLKDNKYKLTEDEDTLMKYYPCPKPADGDPDELKTAFNKCRQYWLDSVTSAGQKVVDFANAFIAVQMSEDIGKNIVKAFNQIKQSKHQITTKDVKAEDLITAFKTFDKVMFKGNEEGAVATVVKINDYIGSATDEKLKAGTMTIGDGESIASECRFNYLILKLFYDHGIILYTTDEVKAGKKRYKKAPFPEWRRNQVNGQDYPEGPEGFRGEVNGKNWGDFINHCLPASEVESDSPLLSAFGNGFLDTWQDAIDKFVDWNNINWIANQERHLWDTKANPGMILISEGKGGKTGTFNQTEGKIDWNPNHTLKAVLAQMGQDIPDSPLTDKEKESQNHKVFRWNKFDRWTKPTNLKDTGLVPPAPPAQNPVRNNH